MMQTRDDGVLAVRHGWILAVEAHGGKAEVWGNNDRVWAGGSSFFVHKFTSFASSTGSTGRSQTSGHGNFETLIFARKRALPGFVRLIIDCITWALVFHLS